MPGEEPRPPVKVKDEKTAPHEPQVIHGSPSMPPEATGSKGVIDTRSTEKTRVEPPPTVKPERPQKEEPTPSEKQRTYQNFGTANPRTLAPVEPDSVQPKQHAPPPQHEDRTVEKRGESRQQGEGRDEKPKKGDQGGN